MSIHPMALPLFQALRSYSLKLNSQKKNLISNLKNIFFFFTKNLEVLNRQTFTDVSGTPSQEPSLFPCFLTGKKPFC